MKITKNSKITVRGWWSFSPSYKEFIEMLDAVQIGANQDCDVTVDGVTKTMGEWQMEWQEYLDNVERETEEQVKRELGVTHWSN